MHHSMSVVLAVGLGVALLAREAQAQATFTSTGAGEQQPAQQPAQQQPVIPIGGSVGPDGAYHPAPYTTPFLRDAGGAAGAAPAREVQPASPGARSSAQRESTVTSAGARASVQPTERTATIVMVQPAPAVTVQTRVGAVTAPAPETRISLRPTAAPRGGGPVVSGAAQRNVVVYPLSPGARRPLWIYRPRLVIGVGGGTGNLVRDGEDFTRVGGSWQAELGAELHPAFAVMARYTGAWTTARSEALVAIGNADGVLTSAGSVLLHLALPTPWVRPSVHAGIGFVTTTLLGESITGSVTMQRTATAGAVPIGGGLEIAPRPWSIAAVRADFTWHFVFDDWFDGQRAAERGDLWTLTGGVRLFL